MTIFSEISVVLFHQTESYISYRHKTAAQLLFHIHCIYCLIFGTSLAMPTVNRLTYCHELLSVPGRAGRFFLITTTTNFPTRHWTPTILTSSVYLGRNNWCVKPTTHLCPITRLRVRGALPPIPLSSSWPLTCAC
jgi:hypothetical protein